MNDIELYHISRKLFLSWYLIKQKGFLNLTLFDFLLSYICKLVLDIDTENYCRLLLKLRNYIKKIFKKQYNTKWTNMVEMKKTTFSPHLYAESISAWSNQGSVIQSF